MVKKEFINPAMVPKPAGYTHVVKIIGLGTLVLISGQVAEDKEGKIVGVGDIEAQTRQVFVNLGSALEAAGASFDDLVGMHTYMVDIKGYKTVRQIRSKYLNPENPPASTLVEVKNLAKHEYLIEVEAMAIVH